MKNLSKRCLLFFLLCNLYYVGFSQECTIGFFQVSQKHISTAAKIGAQIIHHYHFEGWKNGKYQTGKNNEALNYLDLAQKHNLKVLMGFDRYSLINNNIQHIKERIDSLKNHPALAYWYLADEPDVNFLSRQRCQYYYELIRQFDPFHPVVITISSNSPKLAGYDDAADIIIVDSYPIRNDYAIEKMGNVKYRINLAKKIQEEKNISKPIFAAIQSFEKNYGDVPYRYPNLLETKYMAFSALFEGAKGVFFYSLDLSTAEHIEEVLKPAIENLDIFNNYDRLQISYKTDSPMAFIKKGEFNYYILANYLSEPVFRHISIIESLPPVEIYLKSFEFKTITIRELN